MLGLNGAFKSFFVVILVLVFSWIRTEVHPRTSIFVCVTFIESETKRRCIVAKALSSCWRLVIHRFVKVMLF